VVERIRTRIATEDGQTLVLTLVTLLVIGGAARVGIDFAPGIFWEVEGRLQVDARGCGRAATGARDLCNIVVRLEFPESRQVCFPVCVRAPSARNPRS
jgi:hypothetical protein